MGRFLWAFTVVLFATAFLAAQTNEAAMLRRGNQEVGFWGAYSPDSNAGIGKSLHRKFFELDAQYSVTMLARKKIAVKWVSEVVPLALLTDPPGSRKGATTYGAGFTPLGMQVNLRNGRRVQPYLDAHGGMLYFTRQEPVPNSSQFNFTFNFGAGLQVFTGARSSLLLGYKYHHISNNETAPQNPGVDSSEVYAGYAWRWRGMGR